MFPPVIFINLKRREDRFKSCTRQFAVQGLPFEYVYRFEAKDARTYQVDDEDWRFFEHADFMHDERIRKPIVCNFLSHYDIWNIMIEKHVPYLIIMQDDIVLRDQFMQHVDNVLRHLPEDAELVTLGLPEQIPVEHINAPPRDEWFIERVTPAVSRLHPTINPCSLCYLLTLRGAQHLVQNTLEHGVHRAGDGFMNDYCVAKNIFYCSSVVLATHNRAFGSDIF